MIQIRFNGRSVNRFLSARPTGLPWLWLKYTPGRFGYRRPVTLEDLAAGAPGDPMRDAQRQRGESTDISTTVDASAPAPVEVAAAPATRAALARVVPTHTAALAWVEPSRLGTGPGEASYGNEDDSLLVRRPIRTPFRPGVLLPVFLAIIVVAAYVAGTLVWPLHALQPTITAEEFAVQPAAAAAAPWPEVGSAAVAIAGIPGSSASTTDRTAMASIAKVVTALVVLDDLPLALGEQGPQYRFTGTDRARMLQLGASGESVLPVPVGGTLTQYQLLQGMLIGSAGNYAERLIANLYPSSAIYARAANTWLARHGVRDITIVDQSGIGQGNTATPEALLQLAELALANPVIAEIVAQQSVDLPGAGLVKNTNALLADPEVIGVKTGYLNGRNLLTAKRVVIDDTTITLYASVLDQPTSAARDAATTALFDNLESALAPHAAVTKGTVAGEATTRWGETVDVVLGTDAMLIGWNGTTGTPSSTFDLGDHRDAGDTVGKLVVTGPLNTANVELQLREKIEGPGFWWRLTHPLDLLGLV